MMEKTLKEPDREQVSKKMGEFLSDVFAEFCKRGMKYCVLRNYESLPYSTTNDVDLLVEADSIEEAVIVFRRTAKAYDWRIVRVRKRFQFLSLYLLWTSVTENGDQELLKIDVWWGDTQWKAVPSVSSNTILENTLMFRKIRVASPGPSSAVILAKEYLQFGKMGKGSKEKRNKELLVKAIKAERKLFEETLEVGFGKRTTKNIIKHIVAEDWDWLDQQHYFIRLVVILRSLLRRPFRQLYDWYCFAKGHLTDKVIFPSGLVIAFCGPDGSGKTTIAKRLETKITTSLGEVFSVVHHRHGHYGYLPNLKVIYNYFARKMRVPGKKDLSLEEVIAMPDEPSFSIARATFYLLYYSIDYLFGHFFVLRTKAMGNVVIFDRYYYDYFVNSNYDRIPDMLKRALFSLFPQPQILIFLDGDARTIHNRKPELRVNEIIAQQNIYSQIIDRTSSGHICNAVSVIEETQQCVWEKLLSYLEQVCHHKLEQL